MRRSKLPALRPSKVPMKAEKQATPKAELGPPVDKSISLSTLRSTDGFEAVIRPSRPINECHPKEQQKLFLEKCRECCTICDFSQPSVETKAKQIKSTLLKHIAAGFTIPHLVRSMHPESIKEFYSMLSINLFRPFPQMPTVTPIETHDSLYDASWPHLSLSYDALLASFNCPIAPDYITESFLYRLIGNCASPDDREKAVVRDILHTLYTKFMKLRELCRKCIAMQFSNDVVSYELIEFFLSVVSGFNTPLKDDHVDFYYKHFITLHSSHFFPVFQKPYVQCIIRFISKSILLFSPTIMYISKHWPCSDRKKQIEYLNELNMLLLAFEINVTPKTAQVVFKIIGDCVESENADVSEAAVDILLNNELATLIKSNSSVIFPVLIEPVYRAAKYHWDNCTKTNAYVVLQVLSEIDNQTFNKANEAHKLMKTQKSAAFGVFKNNWIRIFEAAKNADRTLTSVCFDGLRM
jgi:serine/threonine-protein phosphatase 2A regulatory subunit B'